MRIGFFLDFPLDSPGGIQQSVLMQKKYLEKLGHTVVVVASEPQAQVVNHADIEVPSKQLPGMPEYCYFWPTTKTYKRIEKQIDTYSLDVVHVQGIYWSGIVGMRYAYRRNLPIVETIHDNYYYALKHIILKPWLYDRVLRYYILQATGKTSRDYIRARIKAADAVIVPSEYFRSHLKTAVYEHVRTVGSGVDDEVVERVIKRIEKSSTRHIPLRVVWAGRITGEKRILEAVETAVAAGVEMTIYGNGPLESVLIERLKQPDAGQIVFKGLVAYEKLLEAMRKADYLFLSSYHFETQGMVAYEALAVETPVLLADDTIAANLLPSVRLVSKSSSVEDMTAMLKEATAIQLTVGLEFSKDLRQSYKTKQIVGIYESVLQQKRKRR